jgi:signal peptidase I
MTRLLHFPTFILTGLQAVAAACLIGLVAMVLAASVPSLFGNESFVVYSGSMEPTLGVGDLAVVAPVRSEDLRAGDVITYRSPDRLDVVVTHRLAAISADAGGHLSFQTKGDANNAVDMVAVNPSAVLGRLSYSIPKLGYVVDFAQRPMGRMVLIAIPALLLALDYLLASSRKRFSAAMSPAIGATEELLIRGREAMNSGALSTALKLFDEAIARDPRLEEAWLLKAECLRGMESAECLQAGLTVNPTSTSLRRALERVSPSTTQRTI